MNVRQIGASERTRLEVIDCKRNRRRVISSATAINQHLRASVVRLVLDSELEVPTLRKAAHVAGMSEPQVLDILRDYVYDLRAARLPDPPNAPAVIYRRAA